MDVKSVRASEFIDWLVDESHHGRLPVEVNSHDIYVAWKNFLSSLPSAAAESVIARDARCVSDEVMRLNTRVGTILAIERHLGPGE